MRRILIGAVGLAVLIAGAAPAGAANGSTTSGAPVVQEWNADGTPADATHIGWSVLRRSEDGLRLRARVGGLIPGGVYTFWLIAVQDDGTFPDDVFLAYGASAIAGPTGRAQVRMAAEVGDPGITGFVPDGVDEVVFDSLHDTVDSTVRVEIAYHGQATDAGDDLATWLSDFWTGTACPPETPNPIVTQPHCPVYYATTHLP